MAEEQTENLTSKSTRLDCELFDDEEFFLKSLFHKT